MTTLNNDRLSSMILIFVGYAVLFTFLPHWVAGGVLGVHLILAGSQ